MAEPTFTALANGYEQPLPAEFADAYVVFSEFLAENLEEIRAEAILLGIPWPEALRRRLAAPPRPEPMPDVLPTRGRIEVGDLTIDLDAYTCVHQGKRIVLAHREFELLKLLAGNAGRVTYYTEIVEKLWPGELDATRTIQVHVKRIRQKLGPDCPISTVPNVGYRYEQP